MRKLKKTSLAGLLLAACLAGYQCGIVSTAAESGDGDGFAAEISSIETDEVQNDEVLEKADLEEASTLAGLEEKKSEETGVQAGLEAADSENADTERNKTEVMAEGNTNGEEKSQEETESDEEFESIESEGFTDEVISNFSDNKQAMEADPSKETVTEGNCGMENAQLFWKLNENGTLEIAGTGNMMNWEKEEDVPWTALREKISRIKIAEGVLSVGAHAFSGCQNAAEIQIPDSVQEIGEFAFFNCSAVSSVTIG